MTSSSPKTPDPYATAQAQGQMNVETARVQAALNRVNSVGPDGTVSFNEISPDRWQQVTTLSPGQQRIYDAQTGASALAAEAARSSAQRIGGQLGTAVDTFGLPDSRAINVSGIPGLSYGVNGAGQGIRRDFEAVPGLDRVNGAGVGIQGSVAGAGEGINTNFSAGNPLARVGPDDFSADRQRVEQALLSRTEPAAERDRAAMEARLAAQGFTSGTQGYRDAADELNRQKNDARMQAVLAGGQEQSRLFGLDLSRTGFNNSAQQQELENLNNAGVLGNAAQAQQFGQRLGAGQFVNQAQQQGFAQGVSQVGANNQAALDATNSRNAAIAAQNEAQAQQVGQEFQNAGLRNAAVGQDFNTQSALAASENNRRSQMLAERLQLRAQPINEVASLFGLGNGIQVPQAAQAAPVQVGAPDYQGIVAGNARSAQAAAAADNASKAQAAGTLVSVAATAIAV